MSAPDQLGALMKPGLFRSVDIISSFSARPPARALVTRARALIALRKFASALRTLDSIEKAQRTEDDMNEILELKFTCYFANRGTSARNCAALLPSLLNRTLTPKLHILAADAYVLQNAAHSPNHPAIPHLLEVLRIYPAAVELAEKGARHRRLNRRRP